MFSINKTCRKFGVWSIVCQSMRSSCSSERSIVFLAMAHFFTLSQPSLFLVFVWMLAYSSSCWYSLGGSIHTFDSSRGLELEVEVHDWMMTAVFYTQKWVFGGGGWGGVSHMYMITIKSWDTLLYANTVFILIVAAATINFSLAWVLLLIEGGSYSRAAFINFGPSTWWYNPQKLQHRRLTYEDCTSSNWDTIVKEAPALQ